MLRPKKCEYFVPVLRKIIVNWRDWTGAYKFNFRYTTRISQLLPLTVLTGSYSYLDSGKSPIYFLCIQAFLAERLVSPEQKQFHWASCQTPEQVQLPSLVGELQEA